MSEVLPHSPDVAVVGGGPAGLNAALVLARMRRSVVVIDAGAPRNAPAGGVHGLLGLEGTPPGELLDRGRAEVRGYGGHVVSGTVDTATSGVEGFTVGLADGRGTTARRLLVTTGLRDELPDVAGLGPRWGRDVLHCPYCHGWEVRDQAVGVLGSGPMSVHQALLLRGLTDDLTFFPHTRALTDEDAGQLAAVDIRVVDGTVTAVHTTDDRLSAVEVDGRRVPRQALAVSPRMVARSELLAALGLRASEHPSGAGEHVPSDATGCTEVPGVWVAGNVTDLSAQVGTAAAAGATAAARINADLLAGETARAVQRA